MYILRLHMKMKPHYDSRTVTVAEAVGAEAGARDIMQLFSVDRVLCYAASERIQLGDGDPVRLQAAKVSASNAGAR